MALGWLWVGLTRFDGHLGGQCAWVFCLVYLFLEVHRSLVAQRTVAALAMVIGFHIGEEVAARLGAGGIASTQADAFSFVGGHEAFHDGIVVGIARPTHAGPQAGGRQHRPVLGAGILGAPVAVMEQALGGGWRWARAIWRAATARQLCKVGPVLQPTTRRLQRSRITAT